jgi:hypothetical protein
LFDDSDVRSGIDDGHIPQDGTGTCFFGLLAGLTVGQVWVQRQVLVSQVVAQILEFVKDAALVFDGLWEGTTDGGVETRATVADHQLQAARVQSLDYQMAEELFPMGLCLLVNDFEVKHPVMSIGPDAQRCQNHAIFTALFLPSLPTLVGAVFASRQ